MAGMLLELVVVVGAHRQRTPALPHPPSCFLRAVSHNRKRVHEASAGLFRSQEFPLRKLRGALRAGGGRPEDWPSYRSHSGSVWASPARGVIPGPPLSPPAWPCPLWAEVEAPGWGIPALQGRVSSRHRLQLRQLLPSQCRARGHPGPCVHVGSVGFLFFWAALGSCPACAAARHADLGVFLAAQRAGRRAHLAEREGRLRAGLAWRLAVGLGLFARRVRVSFCTETFSVDEMRSCRASLGGTD